MSLPYPIHPGFFEVLASRRAYTTLLYLLLSLATGIFAFTYALTGLSLSLGLAILIIGIPVVVAFLAGTRLLSVAEVHLLKALVGGGAEGGPALMPHGEGWLGRLKTLVSDRRTWTSLLYFVLHLPLGIAYFTLMVTLLSPGLGLLAMPLARLFHFNSSFNLDVGGGAWILAHPGLATFLCGLAGLFLLPLTLHLGLVLGRFQVWLGRHLLVRA